MREFGFIGFGHMGSVLLHSFLATQAILADQVVISTRSLDKLDTLKAGYPAIEIVESNREVARRSATLFMCVGTKQVKPVLTEIQADLNEHVHLILLSGGLEITSVERIVHGPISKIIPTIIAEVQEGFTLVSHNAKVSAVEKDHLTQLLEKIGQVKTIPEDQFEIGADFTSCAPGLLASICEQYVQAGIKHGKFTRDEATEMLLHTLYGTAKLLLQNHEDFKALTQRVATKGGATEGGVSILEAELPEVFEKVFNTTLQRHEIRKQFTRQQFDGVR